MMKLRMSSAIEDLEMLFKEYVEETGVVLDDYTVDWSIEVNPMWDIKVDHKLDIIIYYQVKDDNCHNAKISKKVQGYAEHNIMLSLEHMQYNFIDNEMYVFYEVAQYCACNVFNPRKFVELCESRLR